MRWREFAAGLGTALAVLGGCAPGAIATSMRARSPTTITGVTTSPAAPSALSLQASPSSSVSDHRVVLSGRAVGVPAGSIVRLYRSAYPYPAAALIQTTMTRSDGSFAFAVFPDRDVRYRVTLVGGAASALVRVHVTGVALTKVKAISLGRARVRIVVFHPRDLRWGDARISWWVRERLSPRLHARPRHADVQAQSVRDRASDYSDAAGGPLSLARLLPRPG